jgi:hypothetical protein
LASSAGTRACRRKIKFFPEMVVSSLLWARSKNKVLY